MDMVYPKLRSCTCQTTKFYSKNQLLQALSMWSPAKPKSAHDMSAYNVLVLKVRDSHWRPEADALTSL